MLRRAARRRLRDADRRARRDVRDGLDQPPRVVLVVVVDEAGADRPVGVQAEEALELVGVVVAVPDRDLARGERGRDLRRRAAGDVEHQRRDAVRRVAVERDAVDRGEPVARDREQPLLVRADRVEADLEQVVGRRGDAGERLERERPELEPVGRLVGRRARACRAPAPPAARARRRGCRYAGRTTCRPSRRACRPRARRATAPGAARRRRRRSRSARRPRARRRRSRRARAPSRSRSTRRSPRPSACARTAPPRSPRPAARACRGPARPSARSRRRARPRSPTAGRWRRGRAG